MTRFRTLETGKGQAKFQRLQISNSCWCSPREQSAEAGQPLSHRKLSKFHIQTHKKLPKFQVWSDTGISFKNMAQAFKRETGRRCHHVQQNNRTAPRQKIILSKASQGVHSTTAAAAYRLKKGVAPAAAAGEDNAYMVSQLGKISLFQVRTAFPMLSSTLHLSSSCFFRLWASLSSINHN